VRQSCNGTRGRQPHQNGSDRRLTWARALHSFAQLKAESPKTSYCSRCLQTVGSYFKEDWLIPVLDLPPRSVLNSMAASDYAVTSNGGDFTVHVVIGIDPKRRMFLLDLWRQQTSSNV